MKTQNHQSPGCPASRLVLTMIIVISALWLMASTAACRHSPAGSVPGRPDFSGIWTLNLQGSNFAGETAPESKVQRVEQKENTLEVAIDEVQAGRPVHGTSHYTLDGRESVNQVFGNPLKATINWSDGTMVMRTWGPFGGAEILLIDRWSLSPDSRILRIDRHFEGHGKASDQQLVFDKQ